MAEARHFRSLFLSDVHLGTQGLPGRPAARLPAPPRCRHHLSGRRHRRRLAAEQRLVLAAGAQRRRPEAPAQGAARAPASSICRAITTNSCATISASHFGGVEVVDDSDPRDGRRQALPRHPWRPVRRGGAPRQVARLSRRLGLHAGAAALNTVINRVRRRLGLPYWSLSAWAKLKVKNAVNFIGELRGGAGRRGRAVAASTASSAAISTTPPCATIGGIRYINTGDWVESCTAVVEHHDGRLEIISWTSGRDVGRAGRGSRTDAGSASPARAAA